MESLQHNDMLKEYPNELLEVRKAQPELFPVRVTVSEDAEKGTVKLQAGQMSLTLPLNHALDLAKKLRKAANKIGVRRFEQQRKNKRHGR